MFNSLLASRRIERINVYFICFKFKIVRDNKKTLNCKDTMNKEVQKYNFVASFLVSCVAHKHH